MKTNQKTSNIQIVSILSMLKEAYEINLISEEAFISLTKPIVASLSKPKENNLKKLSKFLIQKK